jgi:hypothetical protein
MFAWEYPALSHTQTLFEAQISPGSLKRLRTAISETIEPIAGIEHKTLAQLLREPARTGDKVLMENAADRIEDLEILLEAHQKIVTRFCGEVGT